MQTTKNHISTKPVAIVQSNYIPWKGYFDLINASREFLLYDDVQYTRRDWRNRNLIKTAHGPHWLSVPVQVKGRYFQKISDTFVSNQTWAQEHFQTIAQTYAKAPCFKEYREELGALYEQAAKLEKLSDINHLFITKICDWLNIKTKIRWSSELDLVEGKSERLLGLCQQLCADEYISGPAAKDYLDESIFAASDIKVTWFDYSGYPEYEQFHPPFLHGVTVLDLLFHKGKEARNYMKKTSQEIG